MRGLEWNGDAAARCHRQRSKGIGEFPQQAENHFRVTKALLAEDLLLMRSRHFLFTLKVCCAIMSIEFFDGLETT